MNATRTLTAVAAAAALGAFATASVQAAAALGERDYYGPIDITDNTLPQPQLVSRNPVVVARLPGAKAPPAVYLRVPPEQMRGWRAACARYGACSKSVYFVDDKWYRDVFVPAWREHERGNVSRP